MTDSDRLDRIATLLEELLAEMRTKPRWGRREKREREPAQVDELTRARAAKVLQRLGMG